MPDLIFRLHADGYMWMAISNRTSLSVLSVSLVSSSHPVQLLTSNECGDVVDSCLLTRVAVKRRARIQCQPTTKQAVR
jgi:hypothetical protein